LVLVGCDEDGTSTSPNGSPRDIQETSKERAAPPPIGTRTCQPPLTSATFWRPAPGYGHIARSRPPTSSIWWSAPCLRRALKFSRPLSLSATHSLANFPHLISRRIFFISALVRVLTMRGPRVTSPYSAVSLIE